MAFRPFALEEWQSRHEQGVEFKPADSGVAPVRLREPSHPQVEGIARNRGCRVRTFALDPEDG